MNKYLSIAVFSLLFIVLLAGSAAPQGQLCLYQIYSPSGGEIIAAGSTYRIEYDQSTCSCCDGSVNIELSIDGGGAWSPIVENHPANLYYWWEVPEVVSDDCLIRVCGAVDDPCGASLAPFSITDTLPDPGAQWMVANCDDPTLDGLHLPPWTTVDIYDHDGVRCASQNISIMFGLEGMRIYADDPKTADDEGADPAEVLQVHVDGRPVFTDPPLVWTGHGNMTQLCDFYSEHCYRLDLDSGWHLISWPVEYSAQLQDFIADWSDCIDVMMGFDMAGRVYNSDFPHLSTLGEVDSRRGYWIRLHCPVNTEVCGSAPVIYESTTLHRGWNLVGYHAMAAAPADLVLGPIADKIEVVYGFDGGFEVWDPAAKAHSTLDTLRPGHGYWIRVRESWEWKW